MTAWCVPQYHSIWKRSSSLENVLRTSAFGVKEECRGQLVRSAIDPNRTRGSRCINDAAWLGQSGPPTSVTIRQVRLAIPLALSPTGKGFGLCHVIRTSRGTILRR